MVLTTDKGTEVSYSPQDLVMSNPRIIAFTGTVGAGKSTQTKLLASKLKTKGLRVKITFLKTGHLLAYILEVALVKTLVGKRKDVFPISVLIEEKPRLFKKLFKLWLTLDTVSISTRFLLTVYLPVKMHRVVLVEEYLHATIADYAYLARVVGLPLRNISSVVSFMLRLLRLGGSVQTIFLDAPNVALEKRWSRRASLKEKPNYLRMQRTLLLSVSKKLSQSFLYIETSDKTIEETHNSIIKHFDKILDIRGDI